MIHRQLGRIGHKSFLIVALLLSLSLQTSVRSATHTRKLPKNAKALHGALKGVRSKIHQQRAQLHQTKQREHKITAEIELVETHLIHTQSHLSDVKTRLRVLAKQQALLQTRIEAAQQRLEGRRRLLARRLRDNYERGVASNMPALLQSRSMHDYLSRSYYVERIVESDTQLIAGIRADRQQLTEDQRALNAQTEEQKTLRSDLETQTAAYRTDVIHRRDLLHQVQVQRENMEEALDQLEEASHEIEARLRALQQTPRGRQRLLHAWTGSFMKPAAGPITSGFGMRFHPILHKNRMHTGVDIGAGYGAAIHAAGDGEVVMAAYYHGYGNCVIIDHGGGVSTLYGHCSALLVSEGQYVHKGQLIARVGSTGLATGPHLHFEVRHNGTPVNPF